MIETQLSAYRILDELGSGGMGKVYLAELAEKSAGLDQGQRVALKVIHPHLLETKGFFKRFLREAEIGQAVQQDNVVRTYDCDAVMKDGSQHNFLVMEYVEGQTLRDLLQELGTVPEELCRHIAQELARALDAIHTAGVVHRDLKPENVLITKEHVVKVMDLGVARLQDEIIRLSQTGAFVGSVHYAAPEQFMGGGEDVDGRADLHALGAMLYELSTGRHPFQDDDVKVVLRRILSEDPRRAGEINPQLSPFFEEVVHCLLAKDRNQRFESADELLRVLEAGEESDWWKERAQALRVETKKPLRRVRVPRGTALYGREGELERLRALFEKAKGGHGQVLLIEGEAGIGRTRLVDEFVGRMQQEGEDLNFLFGDYPPGGAATAAGAFSTAYREHFGAESLEVTLQGYLSESPLLIPAFAALLRGDPTPKAVEPLTKDSLQTVFVHATRALAAERPTVVLIDDLHFAPEEGRAVFAALALAIPEHRVLLVGTSRHGLPEDWLTGLERADHASRLTLARLSPKHLAGLLRDAFSSERLAQELAFQVAEKSDGNPFFVFEIIRGLREGEFITQSDDGTWVSTQVIQDIQIPSSVVDLIQARITDLDEEDKDILDVASCCGFEFDPLLVGAVLGLADIPLLKRLARIEKSHRLVRASGRRYVFDHHQVQESLYASLSELLRERYHAALADALEARAGAAAQDPAQLDGVVAMELCDHLMHGDQGARALRYLNAALDHLEKGHLNDAAIDLADRALKMDNHLTDEARVDLLLRQADRLGLLGREEAQGAALEEALRLAETLSDPLLLARVRVGIGQRLLSTSRYQEALESLQRALEALESVDDKRLEAKAEKLSGTATLDLGRHDEARAHYERGMALAHDASDRTEEGACTNNLAIVYEARGQRQRAVELYEQAVTLLRDTPYEGVVAANLASQYESLGRAAEAQALRKQGLEMAQATGNRYGEATVTSGLGHQCTGEGRYEEALALLSRSLVLTREIGARRFEADAEVGLGGLYLSLGVVDVARRSIDSALAISREIGRAEGEASALAALGRLAQQECDHREAERRFEEALTIRQEVGARSSYPHLLIGIARCLRAQDKPEDARSRLEEAAALAQEQDTADDHLLALSELACLPNGDAAAAVAALEKDGHRVGAAEKLRARFLLWQATTERAHLADAHELLMHLRDHAPEAHRDTMIENVPLHRDIVSAWEQQPA